MLDHLFGIAPPDLVVEHRRVMASEEVPNERSTSTTWRWQRVKIATPPQAEGTARAKRAPITSLLPWPRDRKMTLTVKYRGGSQCWWEITARGRTIRRPGVLALHDVLSDLYGWHQGVPLKTSSVD